MNADRGSDRADTEAEADTKADAEAVARLLPAPAEWDLPPDRHLRHKDRLMQQIDHDQQSTTAQPVTDPPARRPRLRRPRFFRPAVLLPATALALSGVLLATLAAGGDADRGPAAPAVGSDRAGGAAVLLNRIAAASMATDATPVRDDQFVYVRSVVRENEGTFEGPVQLGAPHRREVWTAQDPAPLTEVGLLRESGGGVHRSGPVEVGVPDGAPAGSGGVPAGIDRPTYTWLASLPTDPEALRTLLYERTRPADGETRDAAVFSRIGELVGETIVPPATAAAFYRVVAGIPGVTEVPDAVDAAGRHGVGITLENTGFATREEWIFDRESLAYLGSRHYIDKSGTWRRGDRVGTLSGVTATLERAVVDKAGQAPAKAASRSAS
ncbi:CU044_5270 family protein [Streptomyces paludis]|uniref:CU044_5270 family protein n=1 Tax=Streptomyces paludis TaxID=2282738 RepID=A0A345HT20_9ACTN|nr:CU044_5270 family protein [Streptomyces paludis]AXG79844.1 hypothetical protein DVK44_21770 [Streptomyces paludis]